MKTEITIWDKCCPECSSFEVDMYDDYTEQECWHCTKCGHEFKTNVFREVIN